MAECLANSLDRRHALPGKHATIQRVGDGGQVRPFQEATR